MLERVNKKITNELQFELKVPEAPMSTIEEQEEEMLKLGLLRDPNVKEIFEETGILTFSPERFYIRDSGNFKSLIRKEDNNTLIIFQTTITTEQKKDKIICKITTEELPKIPTNKL